jgi:hypothetical protein
MAGSVEVGGVKSRGYREKESLEDAVEDKSHHPPLGRVAAAPLTGHHDSSHRPPSCARPAARLPDACAGPAARLPALAARAARSARRLDASSRRVHAGVTATAASSSAARQPPATWWQSKGTGLGVEQRDRIGGRANARGLEAAARVSTLGALFICDTWKDHRTPLSEVEASGCRPCSATRERKWAWATCQTQVGVQVAAQVGRAPPYDHWAPRSRPHPSLTSWLKPSVQKVTLRHTVKKTTMNGRPRSSRGGDTMAQNG